MGATKTIITINGQLVAEVNQTASNSGYKLRSNIGYFNYSGGKDYFSGELSSLRIYGRALTLQEAQNLYTADAPVRDQVITSTQSLTSLPQIQSRSAPRVGIPAIRSPLRSPLAQQ
jgi:hypothetical protein